MIEFSNTSLSSIISQVNSSDLTPIRNFFFSNPSTPLIATGSGGAESVADFASLLYSARLGASFSITPYSMNSISDATLSTSKVLVVSAGGHNNDAEFASQRALSVNPTLSASFCISKGDRNKVDQIFTKVGSKNSFIAPIHRHDGFVSVNTPLAYFALLCKIFDPDCDLNRFSTIPAKAYTLKRNDNSPLSLEDLRGISNFILLNGSWGRPVAKNLEGKFNESGLALGSVVDFRNYCHGRFIYTSQHLEDSALVLFVSPRERDILDRTREFLPKEAKLIIIETDDDCPSASLDLLIKSTKFFLDLCDALGANPDSPRNPGKIDKRKPIWVPFKAELKKQGPLSLI